MSTPTYTAPKDGDPRDATVVNGIFTNLTGISGAVDQTNFADEGLDERSMNANSVTDGRGVVTYAGGMAAPVIGSYPLWTIFNPDGATPHSLTNGGAGWTVGQNVGVVRVVFATEWKVTYGGASPSPLLRFRFEYQVDGGVITAVPASIRQRQASTYIATAGVYPGPGVLQVDAHWYDSIRYHFDIPFPLDNASHTLNMCRVMCADDSGGGALISFDHSTFRAKRFIRTVT
jgi:hypothetical protein